MTVSDANITNRPQRETVTDYDGSQPHNWDGDFVSQHLLHLKRPAPCSSSSASSELQPRPLEWMNHITPVSCDLCVKCIQALLLNSCLFEWREWMSFRHHHAIFQCNYCISLKTKAAHFSFTVKIVKANRCSDANNTVWRQICAAGGCNWTLVHIKQSKCV